MIWLGTSPGEPAVERLLDRHVIGLMCQPESNPPRVGWLWAADNGCFSAKWKAERWLSWLDKPKPRSGCLFAVVPDVVGNHEATLQHWEFWSAKVRDKGYPLAFVAQNGADMGFIPWDELDCLFIGGDTKFKMSIEAFRLAKEARHRGRWVHVGRVNSLKRLREWSDYADSADGTHIAFAPKQRAKEVERWIATLREERQETIEWVP